MAILTPLELARIALLRPELRAAVLPIMDDVERATGKKVTIPPRGGFRTHAQQAALYATASTNPYPVAAPGQSYHEYGAALDLNILGGTAADYQAMGAIVTGTYGLVSGLPADPVHMRLNESLDQAIATWNEITQARVTRGAWVLAFGGVLYLESRATSRS